MTNAKAVVIVSGQSGQQSVAAMFAGNVEVVWTVNDGSALELFMRRKRGLNATQIETKSSTLM